MRLNPIHPHPMRLNPIQKNKEALRGVLVLLAVIVGVTLGASKITRQAIEIESLIGELNAMRQILMDHNLLPTEPE